MVVISGDLIKTKNTFLKLEGIVVNGKVALGAKILEVSTT